MGCLSAGYDGRETVIPLGTQHVLDITVAAFQQKIPVTSFKRQRA
jgi:hypothetical protein